jgi:hypothetical protein
MITRKEYLDNTDLHREYYAQFVTPSIRLAVKQEFGIEALLNSTDPYFNDIFLAKWDRLGLAIGMLINYKLLEETGETTFSIETPIGRKYYGPTAASKVCILKEAARQLVQQYLKED